MPTTLTLGSMFPSLSWPAVSGGVADPNADDGWRLIIVYRGKHSVPEISWHTKR